MYKYQRITAILLLLWVFLFGAAGCSTETDSVGSEIAETSEIKTSETSVTAENQPCCRETITDYRDGEIQERRLKFYDTHDNCVREEWYGMENGEPYLIRTETTVYEYNEDGTIAAANVNDGREQYRYGYSTDGKNIREEEYRNGELYMVSEFIYDDHGEFVCLHGTFHDEVTCYGGRWENEYDAQGLWIKGMRYDCETGELREVVEKTYDENGQIVQETRESLGGEYTEPNNSYYEYQYDENGNHSKTTQTNYIKDTLISTQVNIYAYDTDGRIIRREQYFNDELQSLYEYAYETIAES